MGDADLHRLLRCWIASAVVGTGAGVLGLVRERRVIDGLLASGSPDDRALASTLTTAFVVGAVVGLAVVTLQVAVAVLLCQGHRRARPGLIALAVLVLLAVVLRLTAGDGIGAAATVLLVTQAVLVLTALALLLRSQERTPTAGVR